MTSIVTIPFLVSPYPDELLGSWLFRLQTHNHASLIAGLVDGSKRCNISAAGWRDIANPTPEFQQLLKALGTTHGAATQALTTYPYWLRFHSTSDFDPAGSNASVDLPKLILRNRQKSIPRLRTLLPNHARVCPQCLAEDFERYGEPYLHRAHHLPFVNICHRHRCALVSRCPACEQVFRMGSTFVYARIACTCKFDLRRHSVPKQRHHKTWETFSCFSADVLFSTLPIAECNRVYQFLDARLVEQRIAHAPKFFRYLTTHYGSDAAKALLTFTPQRSDAYSHSSLTWITKREFRAPQICAFFATMDASFIQSIGRFAQFEKANTTIALKNTVDPLNSSSPKLPTSVAQARSLVSEVKQLQGASITRSTLYRRYKTLFWYLVLFDRVWLDENYPNGGKRAPLQIPSILEDRNSILRAIDRAPKINIRAWFNLAQQECFRATLRDSTWLEERKKDTGDAIKLYREEKKRQYLEACTNDIRQAIQRFKETQGNSIRISVADIAPYTALGKDQLRHLISGNLRLREELMVAVDLCTLRGKVVRKRNAIFKPGEAPRRILDTLRTATQPMTSRAMTESILATMGIEATTERTETVQKTLLTVLRTLEGKKLVRQGPQQGHSRTWTIA